MRAVLKSLILLLLVAALPLRGYAAVAAALCDQGGHTVQAAGQAHEATQDMTGCDGDQSSRPSVCSHCAGCSVGVSLAPDSDHPLGAVIAGADRIPFLDMRKPGYVPDRLDRPPLVS